MLGIGGAGGAGGRGAVGGGMATTTGGLTAQLLEVQSLAGRIRRDLQELRANQMADRVATQKCFATPVNANIRRSALQPAGVRGPVCTMMQASNDDNRIVHAAAVLVATTAGGVRAAPASLSPNPKNVFELLLWHEYQMGLGGRKAAKLFITKERGGKVNH